MINPESTMLNIVRLQYAAKFLAREALDGSHGDAIARSPLVSKHVSRQLRHPVAEPADDLSRGAGQHAVQGGPDGLGVGRQHAQDRP